MKNTLVWELVCSLTKAEVREVRNFLASPFFNQREDLRTLFDLLVQETEPPDRQTVYQRLFPGAVFDDQQMRLLLSYLLKLLEQYFVLSEAQSDTLGNLHLLLSAYRRRKLSRHFQKTYRAVQLQLENQEWRHPGFYFANFQVEHQQYLFLSGSGRTKELNLQPVEDYLTLSMLSMKLRQACLLRSHQAVFKTEYNIPLEDEVMALAEKAPFRDAPAVAMYYHCYRALFREQSEEHFGEFKALLFQYGHHFPKTEIRDLYLLALNFCIKKINENQQTYLHEALDLYKEGLKTELLLDDGKLSQFTYNNIVGIALRLEEEWDWVSRFVQHYQDYLEPSQRVATYSLNSARLAFVQRRFDDALLHLQRADYRDLINNMVAKTLQLKIYYEKREWDLLDAHLKTMRMFIRRNQRMGYHHRNWHNIVHFTQKLMELNPYDGQRRSALRLAIESEEILTEKEWLLEQL